MRRRLWAAAALALSACAPPGYVYDPGDILHPHPSEELCASRNLQLDPNTHQCAMPTPPASPPKRMRSPVHTGSPAPAPSANTAEVPIETDAVINNDLRKNTKLLNELAKFVTESGHPCAAISAAQADVASRRFKLVCDKARHTYDIEAKGGHWIVKAP
jgi:hypothetical protein